MKGITGTKTVLRRTGASDFHPTFTGPPGGREYELQMDANVWNSMDRPEEITVTIERGYQMIGEKDD